MEFKNFSLSITQTKVALFAEELAQGRILSTVCRKCGKRYYPPRADCSDCMGSEMEWKAVGGEGRLLTFTKIYVPPEHYSLPQPRMPFSSIQFDPCPVGILEVEEGLRVMGWIPKVDVKKLRVGMKMKASATALPDGKVTIILEPMSG